MVKGRGDLKYFYFMLLRGEGDLDNSTLSNPREHGKTVGFSRGTGGPLDNGGTGEPPFRLVISWMLSTGWTGDQILF